MNFMTMLKALSNVALVLLMGLETIVKAGALSRIQGSALMPVRRLSHRRVKRQFQQYVYLPYTNGFNTGFNNGFNNGLYYLTYNNGFNNGFNTNNNLLLTNNGLTTSNLLTNGFNTNNNLLLTNNGLTTSNLFTNGFNTNNNLLLTNNGLLNTGLTTVNTNLLTNNDIPTAQNCLTRCGVALNGVANVGFTGVASVGGACAVGGACPAIANVLQQLTCVACTDPAITAVATPTDRRPFCCRCSTAVGVCLCPTTQRFSASQRRCI